MTIQLRAAAASDSEAVADVYLAARRAFAGFAPLAHTDTEVREWIAAILIPSGMVTAAVDSQDTVVGMIAVQTEWIEQLYVAPGFTGRGIGARLLAQAKAEHGPPLRLYVFQANMGARRFYERQGFGLVALRDGQHNEEHCPDALYEWTGDT